MQYFNDIFKEPERANIGEIIRVVAYFLSMVDEENNGNLYKAISREEFCLFSILFKRIKSCPRWVHC